MEPAIPFQLDDSHNRFTKDAAVHFGSSQFAIDKDDRNLGYFESAFISSEFHFYLEGITFETDFVQSDSFKYLPALAFESRCGVMDGQTGDYTYIFRCKIRH